MKTKLYTGIPLFLVILLVCTVVPPGAAENQTLAPINMSQPYVYEIRDLSNPITESEIIDLRSNLISKQNHLFRSTEGDGPTLAYANPRILDNGTIVAYGFYIDPEGTTHQLIGVVNDESCIDDMYEIANQWLENMSNEQNLLSSSDVQDGWDCFSQDDLYYEAEPYGLVENNYELYRNIEEDDPDQDCYAVKQFFQWNLDFIGGEKITGVNGLVNRVFVGTTGHMPPTPLVPRYITANLSEPMWDQQPFSYLFIRNHVCLGR